MVRASPPSLLGAVEYLLRSHELERAPEREERGRARLKVHVRIAARALSGGDREVLQPAVTQNHRALRVALREPSDLERAGEGRRPVVEEHGKPQAVGDVEERLETGIDAGYRLERWVELQAAKAEVGDGALQLARGFAPPARVEGREPDEAAPEPALELGHGIVRSSVALDGIRHQGVDGGEPRPRNPVSSEAFEDRLGRLRWERPVGRQHDVRVGVDDLDHRQSLAAFSPMIRARASAVISTLDIFSTSSDRSLSGKSEPNRIRSGPTFSIAVRIFMMSMSEVSR